MENNSVEKELEGIDRYYVPRIIEAVESLRNNSFPPQHRKLRSVERSYRIRVGDYRVIYQVNVKEKLVVIYHVCHRRGAYRRQ